MKMNALTNESSNGTTGIMAAERTHPALGVVGALLGALLGAALWIVLYQIGIIAGIAGIAIAYCACKGYTLFSKSTKLGGIILSVCISVVILLAAVFFCWGLDIYKELIVEYELTLMDAILFVPEIAVTPDFVVEFVKEILMGLILVAVGATPFIRQALHSKKEAAE